MSERERDWHGRVKQRIIDSPYEPFDDIMPGDVIRLNGSLRKVRTICWIPNTDKVHHIEVLKLRRSGYPSPCAIILRTEMREGSQYEFGGIVGTQEICTTDFECAVQREIESDRTGWRHKITEKDTVGVLI